MIRSPIRPVVRAVVRAVTDLLGGASGPLYDFTKGLPPALASLFFRSGLGTTIDSAGNVAYGAHNICVQSQKFDTSWTLNGGYLAFGAGSVQNTTATTAPDGTNTAALLVAGPSTATAKSLFSTTSGAADTLAVRVKAAGYTKVCVKESASTGRYVSFNLATASAIETSGGIAAISITSEGDGWYTLSFRMTTTAASSTLQFNILAPTYTTGDPNSSTFVGDGVGGVYIWGAQINNGPLTAYVPTTTAAVYLPRITHNPASPFAAQGLLVEAQGTNLAAQTDNLSTWSVSDLATVGSVVASPTGTGRVVSFASSVSSQFWRSLSGTSAERTYSIWARSATGRAFRFKVWTGAVEVLSADIPTSTVWQRYTFTHTSAVSNFGFVNRAAGGAGDVEFDAPQVEASPVATSYIPNPGTGTVVRTADGNWDITGAAFTNLWGPGSERTIIVEWWDTGASLADILMAHANPGIGESLGLYRSGAAISFWSRAGGVNQFVGGSANLIVTGGRNKCAFSFGPSGFAGSLNGGSVFSGTGTVPTPTALRIAGASIISGGPFQQTLASLDSRPTALTGSALQALSAL
jgi:hypothetical protein